MGEDGKKQEAKENFAQVIKRVLGKFKTGSRLLIINAEATIPTLAFPLGVYMKHR